MAAIGGLGDEAVGDGDGDWTVAERHRQLEVDQRLDPVLANGDPAAAQRRRQRLGEAADVDHASQPVEAGEPRRRLVLEIAPDVVLDDRHVMRLAQLEHAMGDGGG